MKKDGAYVELMIVKKGKKKRVTVPFSRIFGDTLADKLFKEHKGKKDGG